MSSINIVGAGLAGLSAAIALAEKGVGCTLISLQQSERAQSVLAEGGINAALDTMGENDRISEHFEDTLKGGAFLADPNAVMGLTNGAPEILRWLIGLGVPFNMKGGEVVLRNFGGQKKKRTAYARSSTGKIIMSAVIDEARKYEAKGLIKRFAHHELVSLIANSGSCTGVKIKDTYTDKTACLYGQVILCTGGMNGVFPKMTTGTTQNSGAAAAAAFCQGVVFSNLEMLQYHPTTIGISNKRCLVTEAARGEGGRLFIEKNGKPWYFMEEKYPELKNLMPRDVVAREMYFVRRQNDTGDSVYLDMTGLDDDTWKTKLSDLRAEIISYLAIDPGSEPVPVREGIHYFMGGIDVDELHRTNLKGLYAAGECTSQYHGANRLGGNSMLGALYGGRKAAQTALSERDGAYDDKEPVFSADDDKRLQEASPVFIEKLSEILLGAMGIVRSERGIKKALSALDELSAERGYNRRELDRLALAKAMLLSALERRESRGAHYREDCPETREELRKITAAAYADGSVNISFRAIPERRGSFEDKA